MLIVLLSVTNIALGYGLAVYLGRTRAAAKPATNSRPFPASENTEGAAAEPADELATEPTEDESGPKQQVLESEETIQEALDEQTEPTTADETPVAEAEATTSESPDEQETAASEPATEEELVQGIGDSQDPVKTQQEESELQAVTSSSE